MTPITIPPPVWTTHSPSTRTAQCGRLQLAVAHHHALGWSWHIAIPGLKAPMKDHYVYYDTPEAAESAAWAALSRWLGVTP